MTARLRVSEQLPLPAEDTTTQTLVVYGAKGTGKTNFGVVLAEELARTRQRFAVLDPLGNWWGLRHAADGKGPGVEVLILGGTHGDIPIEPTAGAVAADLVADEAVNVLIDISRRANGTMWTRGEKIRFVSDYGERLFERQGQTMRPLMQIIDEAGRYVPQQIPHGAVDIARCVGAVEQLVELGRNVGIGVCLITQRSARMNKSVSELAECMVAFRTVGPHSVEAILDWFGEHVPKERWKELVEKLRKLPRGTALVVSPGWLEFEGVATMRARNTLDTSATPTAAVRPEPKHGAKPDLEKYLVRMAETIERAKQQDPRELRQALVQRDREIADLRRQLAAAPREAAAAPAPAPVRVEALTDTQVAEIDRQAARLETVGDQLRRIGEDVLKAGADLRFELQAVLSRQEAAWQSAGRPPARAHERIVREPARRLIRAIEKRSAPRRAQPAPTGGLSGPQQKILDVASDLSLRGLTPNRDMIARWLGIHPNGGRYGSDLAALREAGLLDGCIPSQGGHANARARTRGIEGAIEVLEGRQGHVLEVLIAARHPLTRDTLAEQLGIHPNGGRFGSDLARLRTMGIITARGPIAPTEALYQ